MAEYNEKEVRIRNVIDTEQNWLLYNPVLLRGEIGFAIKAGNQIAYKIGDGNTAWSNLPYSINTASEITAMVTNLQNQIDAIVTTSASGGDVAAEVAQSRVGADGTPYQTLKQRLDAEYNALTVEQTNLKEDLTNLTDEILLSRILTGSPIVVDDAYEHSVIDIEQANNSTKVYVAGKNILPLLQLNKSISTTTGERIDLVASKSCEVYIPVDTTKIYSVNTETATGVYWMGYDENKNYIGFSAQTRNISDLFRIHPETKYIRMRFDGMNAIENIMLVVGTDTDTFVPSTFKEYNISETIYALNNYNYLWGNNGSITVKLRTKEKHYVTPQDYGAKGDGITDDTIAFKSAMSHNHVIIPDGNYLISDTINCNAQTIVGVGFPKIIANNVNVVINIQDKSQLNIENLNIVGNQGTALNLSNIKNSIFKRIRIQGFANGISMIENCWANAFYSCTFYSCTIGIYGESNVVNLETSNFYACYFGSNDYGICAKNIQNCHFFGGWFEENNSAIKITLDHNLLNNQFTNVDFEKNINVVEIDNLISSLVNGFSFSGCTFVCSTQNPMNLVKCTGENYCYFNAPFINCFTDSGFKFLSDDSKRTYIGVPYAKVRDLPNGSSGTTGSILYPCFVNASYREYQIRENQKFITNDGKKIKILLPDWVYVSTFTISAENVDCRIVRNYSGAVAGRDVPLTSSTGVSTGSINIAIISLEFTSEMDISDTTITLNISTLSDIN